MKWNHSNSAPWRRPAGCCLWIFPLLLLAAGCGNDEAKGNTTGHKPGDAPPPSNRIDIPPAVRKNLGITFAKVERRHVRSTLRVPGRFESPPDAKRDYHALLGGTVTLKVRQYDPVKAGDLLATIDSPAWRDQQEQLVHLYHALVVLQNEQRANQVRSREYTATRENLMQQQRLLEPNADNGSIRPLKESQILWEKRIAKLEDLQAAGGGMAAELADAREKLAQVRLSLASLAMERVKLQQLMLELDNRRIRLKQDTEIKVRTYNAKEQETELALNRAAIWTGITAEKLVERIPHGKSDQLRWLTINALEIRAQHPGIVQQIAITQGAVCDAGARLLTILDPSQLRFRAEGLQRDLGIVRHGQAARIVPPPGSAFATGTNMVGTLVIAPEAHEVSRTIEFLVTPLKLESWARAGITANLEIITSEGQSAELAIPKACTLRDGLETVLFRRDPNNPDKVIRMVGDLGMQDGEWIEILSGVKEGDEIVREGIYELKLAGAGKTQGGGHFHADGTWHADDH